MEGAEGGEGRLIGPEAREALLRAVCTLSAHQLCWKHINTTKLLFWKGPKTNLHREQHNT